MPPIKSFNDITFKESRETKKKTKSNEITNKLMT